MTKKHRLNKDLKKRKRNTNKINGKEACKMKESEMDKVRKMNVAEIRQLQSEVIAKIETNYDELSRDERKELQNDLKFLEGIRDSKKRNHGGK